MSTTSNICMNTASNICMNTASNICMDRCKCKWPSLLKFSTNAILFVLDLFWTLSVVSPVCQVNTAAVTLEQWADEMVRVLQCCSSDHMSYASCPWSLPPCWFLLICIYFRCQSAIRPSVRHAYTIYIYISPSPNLVVVQPEACEACLSAASAEPNSSPSSWEAFLADCAFADCADDAA